MTRPASQPDKAVQVRIYCLPEDAAEAAQRVRLVLPVDTVRTFHRDGGAGLYLDGPALTSDDLTAAGLAGSPATATAVPAPDPATGPLDIRILAPTREQATAIRTLLARVLLIERTAAIRTRRSGLAVATNLTARLPVLPAQRGGTR